MANVLISILLFSIFLLYSPFLLSLLSLLSLFSLLSLSLSLVKSFSDQMFHALLSPTKNGLFPSANTSLQVGTFIPAAVQQLFSCLYLLEPYGPIRKERKDQIEGEEKTFEKKIMEHLNREKNAENDGNRHEFGRIFIKKENGLNGFEDEMNTLPITAKDSREDESKRNVGDFEFEETDTRSRSSSIFYQFLSKAMCSAVERLKTLNIESDDVTNFLNTHQLLHRCDPVLIVISYPFDVDFSSTSFSSLFSSSSLSCPQSSSSLLSSINSHPFGALSATANNSYLQSAAYSILEVIASMSKNVPPDQIDLIDAAIQAVIDLELPFISPSYFTASENEQSTTITSFSPCPPPPSSFSTSPNSNNVLSASVSERTIIAVLTQSLKYEGISILEKFASQIIQKLLEKFLIHGEGFAKCVLVAKKNYLSSPFRTEKVSSVDEKRFHVLLKIVYMVINTILKDLNGLKNISNQILPYVIKYFFPIFYDNIDDVDDQDSTKIIKTKLANQYIQNSNGSNKMDNINIDIGNNNNNRQYFIDVEDSLLRLTKIDSSLQPRYRNKTLHTTLVFNTIQIFKFPNKATSSQITLALESLPYILTGVSSDSPRPLGTYPDDPTIVSEVNFRMMRNKLY